MTPLIAYFSVPQDMCICILSVVSRSLRRGLFFPPRDTNRNTKAPGVAVYKLLHKVQPGPVPQYRFFCLSARDTVCPSGCDVLRSRWRQAGSPVASLHSQRSATVSPSVSLPTRRRTCSRVATSGVLTSVSLPGKLVV